MCHTTEMCKDRYIFNINEARKAGLAKKEISGLIKHGQVERISRGVYRKIDPTNPIITDAELFESATFIVGKPSAICLHSALHFYGIHCESEPKEQWIMVPFEKRCAHQSIRVFRTRNPKWTIGIDKHQNFNITNLERTIIESLTNLKTIEQKIGIAALSMALNRRLTNLHKLIAMAGSLKVIHRVSEIIKIVSHLK